jgi:hypothetical protein
MMMTKMASWKVAMDMPIVRFVGRVLRVVLIVARERGGIVRCRAKIDVGGSKGGRGYKDRPG